MSVARMKKMNLPDAPKPTKAVKTTDPREMERQQRLLEARGRLNNKNDKVKPKDFWDKARMAKLRRLWIEGWPVKHIARECGAEEKVTQNRITMEIQYGRLESRRRDLTAEDIERIYRLRDAGMSIKLIAKDMKRSAVRIKKILEERKK